jgi:hypothetical protein
MTCNTFASKLESEFGPSVRHHFLSKILNDFTTVGSLLNASFCYSLKSNNGKIRLCLSNDMTALTQSMDLGIIKARKTYDHYELLAGIINFKFLNIMVLFSVGLVWGKVNPEANDNCWKKLVG